jgi:hypothetical protein
MLNDQKQKKFSEEKNFVWVSKNAEFDANSNLLKWFLKNTRKKSYRQKTSKKVKESRTNAHPNFAITFGGNLFKTIS